MKGKQFISLRKQILKKQGKKAGSPDLSEIGFVSKISEGSNIEKLGRIIEKNRGRELLMIAGTGTGKTYSVNQYMERLYKEETTCQRIEFLGVPSSAQARQLEKDGFYVLVDTIGLNDMDFMLGRHKRHKKTGRSPMKVAFVYDKAQTIRHFLKKHPSYQADLFVDEAHKLYTAYSYRQDAIDDVEALISEIKERNGSVVLMTATPRSLAFRESIAHVIYCEGTERIAKYGQVEIVCQSESADRVPEMVYSTIVKEVKAGNRCFVRYNSFEDTGNVSAKLRAINGMNVKVVSSKNKDFDSITDMEGNCVNVYKNDIFNCFVNKSSLPEADCWFTTSMLDEGGSIVKIEGHGQPDNIVAVFVVKDKRFMQLDDIIQFSARIRFPYKKLVIVINRTKEAAEKVAKMENQCWGISKQVDITKKIVEQYTELMKLKGMNSEEIREGLLKFVELENLVGFKSNMDCINIGTDASVGINEKKKALTIYTVYNNQFGDNIGELEKALKSESDCHCTTVTEVKMIEASYDPVDYLQAALSDKKLLMQICDDRITDEEIKIVSHTSEYRKVRELISMQNLVCGKSRTDEEKTREAIKAVCDGSYGTFKNDLMAQMVCGLSNEELEKMCVKSDYEGDCWATKNYLSNTGVLKVIKDMETILGSTSLAVQKIKRLGGDLSAAKKYIKDNMEGYMNEMYLKDRERLMGMDKLGKEHVIILDHLYELSPSGKMKKKTINDSLLNKIVDALNREFGDGAYTARKVKNRILKLAIIQDGDKVAYLKKVKR